jgi:hypothetical protein
MCDRYHDQNAAQWVFEDSPFAPVGIKPGSKDQRCFLRDTSAAIAALARDDPFVVGFAVYTPVGSEPELAGLLPAQFKMLAQRDGDLGSRLSGAARRSFLSVFRQFA